MAFDPLVDLTLLHDYWADDPALSGYSNGDFFQTVPDGVGSDDWTGTAANTFQMVRNAINGQSALKVLDSLARLAQFAID